jgi:hypothetical protein
MTWAPILPQLTGTPEAEPGSPREAQEAFLLTCRVRRVLRQSRADGVTKYELACGHTFSRRGSDRSRAEMPCLACGPAAP